MEIFFRKIEEKISHSINMILFLKFFLSIFSIASTKREKALAFFFSMMAIFPKEKFSLYI